MKSYIIEDALAAVSHPRVDAHRSGSAPVQGSFICDEALQRGIIISLCVQSSLFQQGSRHYQVKYARLDLAVTILPARGQWLISVRPIQRQKSVGLFIVLELIESIYEENMM